MPIPTSTSPPKGRRVNRKPLILAAALLSLFVLFMIQAGKSRRNSDQSNVPDETSLNKAGAPDVGLSIDLSEYPDSVGVHRDKIEDNPSSKKEGGAKKRNIEAEVLKAIQDQQMKDLRSKQLAKETQEKRRVALETESEESDIKITLNHAESLGPEANANPKGPRAAREKEGGVAPQMGGLPGGHEGKEGGPPGSIDKGVTEKRQYLSQENEDEFVLSERTALPLTDYEVKTGDVIPATLVTAINSSLPGNITAQVSRHVYDSRTGKHILIPQGSKLFGRYDSHTSLGEDRLLVVWDRIIFPDSETLVINSMQGIDGRGMSGLKDKVNTHFTKTLVNAFLLSVVSATADKYDKNDSTGILGDIRSEYGDTMERVISEYLNSRLSIKPELEIRAGARFNVMVGQDLIFDSPYKYGFEKTIVKGGVPHEDN